VTGNHVQDEWRAPLDELRTLRESLREEEQRALHERIDGCTAQLVDHYQRDPAQIMR
jgi:hypothetical protein